MRNRIMFLIAVTIAIILLPRVVLTVGAAINMFPIKGNEIVAFDVEFQPWARAAFIAAHAFVIGFLVLIWKGSAPLLLKILTLMLISELVVIYAITLLFWQNGVYASLY